ncbi:DUF3137 domain-containing protein [Demequina sp.]|uniref:DUF3137 domain-containing protein n=1 Tax=Demequina sp. TaxID=2050685 RepID=UPI003D0CA422
MSVNPGFEIIGGIGAFMFVLVPVLMVGMIGFGIYAAVKSYQQAKLRQAAIAATVAANHLGHLAEDPARTKYFESSPFGIGDNRRARDIVWGTFAGRPFETFAYSYETHTTDSEGRRSTTTHHYQITWVPLPGPLPTMRFMSDNALFRAFSKMGARDLDVESHEFNQRWKVVCDDERVGHAILTPRMIERFLQPDVGGRAFAFEGSALVSASQQVSDLGDLQLVVGALNSIVDLVPPFLFAGGSGNPGGSGGQTEGLGEPVQ